MIERPLMTPDELKSMPKGQFVVMKTGFYPMKVKLKLFFKWGIQFDEKNPYAVADQGNRKVEYASKKDIMDGIVKKYRLDLLAPPEPADEGNASGGQDQAKDESSQPQTKKQQTRDKKKTGGSNLQTSPRARRTPPQENKAGGECQWADLISYTKPMCRIGQSSCISISMTAWIRSERRGRG